MDTDKTSSILAAVDDSELSAVTFVRDYLQLHFDGLCLNAYVWPRIGIGGNWLNHETSGYKDALCSQIGKRVIRTCEQRNEKLSLLFIGGTIVEISLKREDRITAEAAMFQGKDGRRWAVW